MHNTCLDLAVFGLVSLIPLLQVGQKRREQRVSCCAICSRFPLFPGTDLCGNRREPLGRNGLRCSRSHVKKKRGNASKPLGE